MSKNTDGSNSDNNKENVDRDLRIGEEDNNVFKVENPIYSSAPFSFRSGSSGSDNGNSDNTYYGRNHYGERTPSTTAGRLKEPREGHSRKKRKVLANYRKDMVFSLSSQGYNQAQISGILHVNQSLVCLTLQQLRKDAAASMRQFLSEKLPLIYNECYESISQVINRSWQLVNDKHTPIQAKVALLSLISDATSAKMELSSGGEVIEQGIAYAQNMKNRYVEITKTTDILHEEDNDNDNTATTSTNEDSSDIEEEGNEDNNDDNDDNNNNDNSSSNNKKNGKVF